MIDLDIISMFNSKFKDDYPDVRKPIICNGLKSIIPYKTDNEKKVTVKEVKEVKEDIIPPEGTLQFSAIEEMIIDTEGSGPQEL